jgi:hypothetical protein
MPWTGRVVMPPSVMRGALPAAIGSHHVMRHFDGRTVVVPVHAGQDIPKGTLRNVLSIVGMTADELRKLL